MRLPHPFSLWILFLVGAAPIKALDVVWNSPVDVPLSAPSFDPTGQALNFEVNFAPPVGTNLIVVNQTGSAFMETRFANLNHGQQVDLIHNGITYPFMADYFGGSGNDLVLVWAKNRVFVWGHDNSMDQYPGMPSDIPSPKVIDAKTDGKTVLSMAAGVSCSFAIMSDGSIVAWGSPGNDSFLRAPFQNGAAVSFPGKIPVSLATGLNHGLVLCSDGTILAWGENSSGQLGNGLLLRPPGAVAVSVAAGSSALAGKKVIAIGAGERFSIALCSDGTLCAWGARVLGHPSLQSSSFPIVITRASPDSPLYQKTITGLSAGFLFAQVVCSDGTIAGWGQNDAGQLGTGNRVDSKIPVAINREGNLSALHGRVPVQLASGGDHGLALCTDGTLTSWGWDADGQRGTNGTGRRDIPTLVLNGADAPPSALFGKTIQRIAGGINHSLALCTDGTIALWGSLPGGVSRLRAPVPQRVEDRVIKLSPAARAVGIHRSALSTHNLLLVAYPNDNTPPTGGDFTLASRRSFRLFDDTEVASGWQDATPPFRYSVVINGDPVINQKCVDGGLLTIDEALTNGVYTVRMEAKDMCNNVAELTKIITVSSTPVEAWRTTLFGTPENLGDAADGLDFDGDGSPNLAEYAFQTNPRVADAQLIPQWTLNGHNMSVAFETPLPVEGVTFAAEWSETLAGGNGAWNAITDRGMQGEHAFSFDIFFRNKVFVRFRITRP